MQHPSDSECLARRLAAMESRLEELQAQKDALARRQAAADTVIAGKIATEGRLKYRLDFQQLITDLLARFVDIGSDADSVINESLRAIGEFTAMDRIYLFQTRDDGRCIGNTHEWCAEGVEPQMANLQDIRVEDELPWFWQRMTANEVFNVPDVSLLPAEAARERAHFELQGIRSLLVVPIRSQARASGFLGFDSVRSSRTWPDDIVYLLKVVSQIIGNALSAKTANDALRTSHELNFKLIETIPDVVIRTDLEGRILYCNEVVLRMGGYRREEVEGRNILDFIAPEDRQRAMENTLLMFESRLGPKEYHLITKDGFKLHFEVNGDVLRHEDGSPFGIVLVCRNLTERNRLLKERQQLEKRLRRAERMEAVGTLAGGIAHEFNNILGIVLGNTELAMEDMPDWSPGKYNLQEVRSASLRARDIVRQLLSFSRKTDIVPKPVDIVAVVRDTLGFLNSYILPPVEIRFGQSVDTAVILGESSQVNQVLIHLCTNAADAMQESGGVLAIRLDPMEVCAEDAARHPGMHPGAHVQLAVSDSGHGMSPDVVGRIFDPYFTTKPVGRGTGMGLAVVHGIVTACGGSIGVESEPGKGTTFKVLLPLVDAQPPPRAPASDEVIGGAEKVLFVDDEPSIASLGRQMLKRLGYEAESRTSPLEALELIRSDPRRFDLVITDMAMPAMAGDRLIGEILNLNPDMPIILCTGFSEKIDEERAAAIGAGLYLEKPVDTASLARGIRRVLQK